MIEKYTFVSFVHDVGVVLRWIYRTSQLMDLNGEDTMVR